MAAVTPGSYCVAEDTYHDSVPIYPQFGPSPPWRRSTLSLSSLSPNVWTGRVRRRVVEPSAAQAELRGSSPDARGSAPWCVPKSVSNEIAWCRQSEAACGGPTVCCPFSPAARSEPSVCTTLPARPTPPRRALAAEALRTRPSPRPLSSAAMQSRLYASSSAPQ